MKMSQEQQSKLDAWRPATIEVIIKLRTWAIRYGASPLKAWDMVSERARLATRRATSVESWVSTIMRSFRISTVDSETSASLVDLSGCVGEDVDEWFNFVADEHQFIMAMARERFDRTKKARKQKTEESLAAADGLLEAVGESRKKKKTSKAKKTEPKQVELI